jgi:hypothetical protein
VLHPVSREHFQVTVVHLHRDMHRDLAPGTAQHLPQTFIQIQLVRGQVEARRLRLPRISFLFQINSLHKVSE